MCGAISKFPSARWVSAFALRRAPATRPPAGAPASKTPAAHPADHAGAACADAVAPRWREAVAKLKYLILDEIHALAPSKRGDLLALGLAQLAAIAPDALRFGLSATVKDTNALALWLASGGVVAPRIVRAENAPPPRFEILESASRTPWSGHRGAMPSPTFTRDCGARGSASSLSIRGCRPS